MKSKGLGDTIAKATKFIGIKQTDKCNCGKRQDLLNKLVPYKKKGAK